MALKVIQRSYKTPGRLIPKRAAGLRARSVILKPGQVMDWHCTKDREELLIILKGKLVFEVQSLSSKVRIYIVSVGQSVFLSSKTMHRLVNRSHLIAKYIYVTGEAARS